MASATAPAPSSLAVPGRTVAARRTSALPSEPPAPSGTDHAAPPSFFEAEPAHEREKAGELRSHIDLLGLRSKALEMSKVPMPLKKGALSKNLRESIASMRAQVDTLLKSDRRQKEQAAVDVTPEHKKKKPSKNKGKSPLGRAPDCAVRRKCAGAPPEADQALMKLRIVHARRHRSSLLVDSSEESSADEAEKEEELSSAQDSSAQEDEDDDDLDNDHESEDDDALGRDAVAAAIAADQDLEKNWDIGAAREYVGELMSSLHVEERVQVLEDLRGYFSDKVDFIKDDTEVIDKFENAAIDEMSSLSNAANKLTTRIDDREHMAYQCLWQYHCTLQKQIQTIPQVDKTKHIRGVRAELLDHARQKAAEKNPEKNAEKSVEQSMAELLNVRNRLPPNITPAEVLAAVASVQEDVTFLKESIELDLRRKNSYEYTLDLLLKEGIGQIHDDEIATQVIQDVRQWVQDRSKSEEGTSRLHREVRDRGAELDKLSEECRALRRSVAHQEDEAAEFLKLQQEKDKERMSPIVEAKRASDVRKRASIDKPEAWQSGNGNRAATAEKYSLFTEDASKDFQEEFDALQNENLKLEEQLAQFQELEGLAKTAVQVLQDSTERFGDAAAQARRNLHVGSLPDEDEEDDDAKLLRELKGIDENLISKQDEEHKQEMVKLEEKAKQVKADIAEAVEERKRLEVQIEREKTRQESILSDILKIEAKHKEAQEELKMLPQLNLDEDEQKLERLQNENARLAQEVEGAKRNLNHAVKRKELNGQALEESRELASTLLTEARKEGKIEEAELTADDRENQAAWNSIREQLQKSGSINNDGLEEESRDGLGNASKPGNKDGHKDGDGDLHEPPPEPSLLPPGSNLGVIVALKKSANQWKGKAKGHAGKVSEEVRKYLDEERRDNEEASKLQAKTLRLHKQIAAIESWAKNTKAGNMLPELPQEEAPQEVVRLRKQVKTKKKELQGMRAHWWNVRELAKRGARIPTGKEAIEIRNAIVNICDEALVQVGKHPGTGNETSPPNAADSAEPAEGAKAAEVAEAGDQQASQESKVADAEARASVHRKESFQAGLLDACL